MSKGKKGHPAKRAAAAKQCARSDAAAGRSGKSRGRLMVIGGLVVALLLVGGVAAFALGSGGDKDSPTEQSLKPTAKLSKEASGDLNACAGEVQDAGRQCYTKEMAAIVDKAKDPLAALAGITAAAYADKSGFLLANCHGMMHTVAREYAIKIHLTLGQLMDHLPKTNDPGCSAGYAHGLITAVAPQIQQDGGPTVAVKLCDEAKSRYESYSCVHGFGHAFMRLNNDQIPPSLVMCKQLGAVNAPDCAQGVYHDYWFSVQGFDDTKKPANPITEPRELCGQQPADFVRPCWYRAFVETASGTRVQGPEDFEKLCGGLEGLQREACVTGASVIGPPDPRNQLLVCAALHRPEGRRGLHPRHQGAEPHQLPRLDVRRPDPGLREGLPGRHAAHLRPLARQDPRRGHQRQVPHHRLPQAPDPDVTQGVRRGREEHERPARDVLLSGPSSGQEHPKARGQVSALWRSGSSVTRSPHLTCAGCSSPGPRRRSAAGPSWSRWRSTPTP